MAEPTEKIPCTVLTGFLGAGKTTLCKSSWSSQCLQDFGSFYSLAMSFVDAPFFSDDPKCSLSPVLITWFVRRYFDHSM